MMSRKRKIKMREEVLTSSRTDVTYVSCPIVTCVATKGFVETSITREESAIDVWRRRVRYMRLAHEARYHDDLRGG